MLIDGDPSHTAESSQYAAQDLGIELVDLPVRAPELNPMEALWGGGKDNVCANRQYQSIDDQVYQFIAYLELLSNEVALRKAGLISKKYWLNV